MLIRTNYDIIPFNWRGRNIVNMLSRSICNIVKDGHRWKAAVSQKIYSQRSIKITIIVKSSFLHSFPRLPHSPRKVVPKVGVQSAPGTIMSSSVISRYSPTQIGPFSPLGGSSPPPSSAPFRPQFDTFRRQTRGPPKQRRGRRR